MKLLLPPLCLLLLSALPRDEVALRFEPEEGTVLKRTFDAQAKYRLTDMNASVDGEPLEQDGELVDYRMSFEEHIAVTDTLRAVAGGRATELLRTFDELRQENTDSVEGEDSETALTSPLEGRSVLFRWNPEEGRYDVEAADDGELDEDCSTTLAEDLDLCLLLPAGEVEVGDEWELDPKLYLAFMWPSGLLDFHAEGEEPSAEDRAPSRQTIERMEGSGTARLAEIRTEDGLRLAVIHVELSITTGSDSLLPASDDDEHARPEIQIEIEIERQLEGTILWDLEHGHAHSAELECEASRLHSESWTITGEQDGEEVSADVEQSRLLEGTIQYTATIERE